MGWEWKDGVGRYTHGDGRSSWFIRYREGRGRAFPQITEKLDQCRTREQGRGVLAQRRASIFDGTYRPRSRRSQLTIVDYLETFDAAKAGKRSTKGYARQIRWVFENITGARAPMSAWTNDTADTLYLELQKRHRKLATANNYFNAVKSELTVAARKGEIERNPLKSVTLTRPNNKRRRFLAPEEIERLMGKALEMPDHTRPIFFGLLYTGWRIGELLSLRRDQLDFVNGLIVLEVSKNLDGRVAPMHPALIVEWQRWIKLLRQERVAVSEHGV